MKFTKLRAMTPKDAVLLELKNIKKYFPLMKNNFFSHRKYVRAVDDVDLQVMVGQHLGLVGESGSGKTTLGRIILRLYPIDSGSILFSGQDITKFSQKQLRPFRRYSQMVFQDPYSSLDPRYTVGNILGEALTLEAKSQDNQRLSSTVRFERMEKVLVSVGLSGDCVERFPHEFSGGERQRIAIARALIMNPRLLVLDEAVSSLDVLIQEQMIRLLKDIQPQYNVTYLFISHNLRVIRKLCTRVAIMYQGKIVETGPTEEIFKNPLHPYTRELLAAAIEYKSSPRNWELSQTENLRLIDKGKGHFVIN